MTAELRRKGKRHGDPISFENYHKAFLLLGEPLTFAEEGEDCLRRIRDGEIRSPAQAQVRKLEKCPFSCPGSGQEAGKMHCRGPAGSLPDRLGDGIVSRAFQL